MPKTASIKPTHKAIQHYFEALQSYRQHGVKHEGAVETAKLNHCALIPKQKLAGGKNLILMALETCCKGS